MKRLMIASVVLLAWVSGEAMASCTSPIVADPGSLLSGKTVCAILGSEEWQEYHNGGGSIVDYKRGSSDPVDPSKTVGTWNATGGSVTYNYGSGGTYSYEVHDNGGGSYTFCGARTIDATLRAGQVSCH